MLLAQIGWTVTDWLGVLSLLVVVCGPIIALLFKQTAEQAGTNARLDSMKESLSQRVSEDVRLWDHVGRHETRLNEHEVWLAQHDHALKQK